MTSIASPFLIVLAVLLHDGDLQARPPRSAPNPALAVVAPEGTDGGARGAAREAVGEGNRLLKSGDVPGAVEAYRRAQKLYPPAAAKIAKAEEARGDELAAAVAFERFLAQSLEIPADFREEARNELHRLSAALGTLQLAEKRPGLQVAVDGQVRAKTPVEGGLWVRPGRHVVTVEEGERVIFRDDVEVAGGGSVRVTITVATSDAGGGRGVGPPSLTLPPPSGLPPPSVQSDPSATAPMAAASSESDRPLWKRWWFWTAIGAAAVAGTATVFILKSRSDCPSGAICHDAMLPP